MKSKLTLDYVITDLESPTCYHFHKNRLYIIHYALLWVHYVYNKYLMMTILSLLYTDLTQVIDIKVVGDGAMEP